MKPFFSILLLLCGFESLLSAQGSEATPFVLGQTEILKSDILSADRVLNIYLPSNYATQDTVSFPVIYVLDGSANEDFIHIVGLLQFLNMYELAPQSIVVGIANIDRKKDFTFPTVNAEMKTAFPTTGGSEPFIAFLEKEVQPFVEKNYRSTKAKTIMGQSLGGLLATEILFKKPVLFDTYIIISPSLWWDDESLLSFPAPVLRADYPGTVNVFVGVGKEGKIMQRDAKRLAQMLKNAPNKNLHSDFGFFPKENHATVLHAAAYKAFRTLYQSSYPGMK